MSIKKHSLSVVKPVKLLNKPLKADFRDFFKGLTNATIQGVFGEWVSAGKHLTESISAIGLKSTPEECAWLLIRNALAEATCAIIKEQSIIHNPKKGAELDKIYNELDITLENANVNIDSSFFHFPKSLNILEDYESVLISWLEAFGLNTAQARSFASRLGTYFVYAIHNEWQKHPQIYNPIREALDTPLTDAAELEMDWQRYIAYLDRQVDEGMMGEPFSLRQIYIPLTAYCFKNDEHQEINQFDVNLKARCSSENIIVVDLMEEIQRWLLHGKKKNAIRVISGGPGCGKSSFAKMIAANVASKNKHRVVYIPLHLFDPLADIREAMGKYFAETGFLRHNPFTNNNGVSRTLAVFDGLDELSMQGKESQTVAEEFIRHLSTFVEIRNTKQLSLQVLLTGRTIFIQSNQAHFRDSKQILHIMPYSTGSTRLIGNYNIEFSKYNGALSNLEDLFKSRSKLEYEDGIEENQRSKWWQAYGNASGFGYEDFPKELDRDELIELTQQPLLNYLVALCYNRGKIDFKNPLTLNHIYEEMLYAVYDRAYGGGTHIAIRSMEYHHFVRILEEIGLSTFHGDGRTTTVDEIEKQCVGAGLGKLLDVFREGATAGVTRMLTAFYFRQYAQMKGGVKTFEFTHKSFGEYLTARRIVGGLQKIDRETERQRKEPDDGWDTRASLLYWLELMGPTPMDQYIYDFFKREIGMKSLQEVERWQRLLLNIIDQVISKGFPFQDIKRRPQLIELSCARNAGEGLLAALCACSEKTKIISTIKWPKANSFATWLNQLQGNFLHIEKTLTSKCLERLDLKKQNLFCVNLESAYMPNSDLSYCVLKHAWLVNAILTSAQFKDADMEEANLMNANLIESNLEGSLLRCAKLVRANMEGATLNKAKMMRADLMGANLANAELTDANLMGVNLIASKLIKAKLNKANLRSANLKQANLQGANLEQANLQDANLEKANLQGANLKQTNLQDANLMDVKMDRELSD
ncbi:MAG: pentapeptide repeat-containing protein [Pseudomonadota bacterium]